MDDKQDLTFNRCPHNRENPYAQISRALIRDASISPGCRWLIIYLLTNTEGFTINLKQVIRHIGGGRDKVRNWVNEAIEAGYLERDISPHKAKRGSLNRVRYIVHEGPKFNKSLRQPENQAPENQAPENTSHKKEQGEKKEQLEEPPSPLKGEAAGAADCGDFSSELEKLGKATKAKRRAKPKPYKPDIPRIELREGVSLTEEDYAEAKERLGDNLVEAMLDMLSVYKLSNGKDYTEDVYLFRNGSWLLDKARIALGSSKASPSKGAVSAPMNNKARVAAVAVKLTGYYTVAPEFDMVKVRTDPGQSLAKEFMRDDIDSLEIWAETRMREIEENKRKGPR